ncbi:MAG: twin-arginine translocase subunit TatC, partial [Actinobacteria bacterium]|nr:twin-arginine translocase subunit TatC [Actinomycetota bacterium]
VFIFAAVATPTGDHINLLLLAGPLLVLVSIAVGICVLNDRRRRKRAGDPDFSEFDDDITSPIDDPEPI